MKGPFDEIITREELRANILELAQPIDFDQLIRDGVLEKSGAWYKVLDWSRLPKHASRKLKTLRTSPITGTSVTFQPLTKSFLRLAERVK